MSHKRAEIKQAFKKIIQEGLPSVADIKVHRPNEVYDYHKPICILNIPKEVCTKFSESPRILERKAYVSLEIVIQGENFVRELDELSFEIEKLISKDLTIGGIASDIVLRESEQEQSPDGEQPIGSVIQVFEVKYHTAES